MPDIGLGEVVVIAVLALLVFGPDRLPKVAADAGRMLRQMRDLATSARKDLIDAAGLQEEGEVRQAITDLDPRRARDEHSVTKPRPAPGPPQAPTPASTAPAEQVSHVDDWT